MILLLSIRNLALKGRTGKPRKGPTLQRSLLIQVLHPFLGKRGPDDITRQVFHGRFVIGRYVVATEDVEPGMTRKGLFGPIYDFLFLETPI